MRLRPLSLACCWLFVTCAAQSAAVWDAPPAIKLADVSVELDGHAARYVELSGFCSYSYVVSSATKVDIKFLAGDDWESHLGSQQGKAVLHTRQCEPRSSCQALIAAQQSSDQLVLVLSAAGRDGTPASIRLKLEGSLSGCTGSRQAAQDPSPTAAAAIAEQLRSPDHTLDLRATGTGLDATLRWARRRGAAFGKVVPATIGRVRGMMALEDIRHKEVFTSLPKSLLLQVIEGPDEKNPVPELITDRVWRFVGSGDFADVPGQLVFVILREALKGHASPWYPYLQGLPKQYNSMFLWSHAELLEVQDERLVGQVVEQVNMLDSVWEMLQEQPITTRHNLTRGLLDWAVCTRQSRAFGVPQRKGPLGMSPVLLSAPLMLASIACRSPWVQKLWPPAAKLQTPLRVAFGAAMAAVFLSRQAAGGNKEPLALMPVADLYNHRLYTKGELRAARSKDAIEMVAGREGFKAGDEVTISYGSRPNDLFLQFYGFVLPFNPEDVVTLTVEDVNVELRAEGFPWTLLQNLRLHLASDEEMAEAMAFRPVRWASEAVQFWELPSAHNFFKVPRFNALEQRVVKVLLEACSKELESKPTTAAQDEALLQQLPPHAYDSRKWLAIQYRLSKKAILQRCVDEQSTELHRLQANPWTV